jgi:hypothetical protein
MRGGPADGRAPRTQRPSALTAARTRERLARDTAGECAVNPFCEPDAAATAEAAAEAEEPRPKLAEVLRCCAPSSPAVSAGRLFVSDALVSRLMVLRPDAPPLARLELSGCRGVTPDAVLRLAGAHASSLTHLWLAGGQLWPVTQVTQLLAAAPALMRVELDVRASAVSPPLLDMLRGDTCIAPRRLLFRGALRDPFEALEVRLASATAVAALTRSCSWPVRCRRTSRWQIFS